MSIKNTLHDLGFGRGPHPLDHVPGEKISKSDILDLLDTVATLARERQTLIKAVRAIEIAEQVRRQAFGGQVVRVQLGRYNEPTGLFGNVGIADSSEPLGIGSDAEFDIVTNDRLCTSLRQDVYILRERTTGGSRIRIIVLDERGRGIDIAEPHDLDRLDRNYDYTSPSIDRNGEPRDFDIDQIA